jgi:hypothetical protein
MVPVALELPVSVAVAVRVADDELKVTEVEPAVTPSDGLAEQSATHACALELCAGSRTTEKAQVSPTTRPATLSLRIVLSRSKCVKAGRRHAARCRNAVSRALAVL